MEGHRYFRHFNVEPHSWVEIQISAYYAGFDFVQNCCILFYLSYNKEKTLHRLLRWTRWVSAVLFKHNVLCLTEETYDLVEWRNLFSDHNRRLYYRHIPSELWREVWAHARLVQRDYIDRRCPSHCTAPRRAAE